MLRKITGAVAGAALTLCVMAAPSHADRFAVGSQIAQGISEFGIGGNNNVGKMGGAVLDWYPEIDRPFLRHLKLRAFAGLGTTNNIASGEKFPMLIVQPGIRAKHGALFADVYPFGIAYAPSPLSGSPYQFSFEMDAGFIADNGVELYLFWKHLSNGDTMKPNPGQDYWGLGISVNWELEMEHTKP